MIATVETGEDNFTVINRSCIYPAYPVYPETLNEIWTSFEYEVYIKRIIEGSSFIAENGYVN